MEIKYTVNGQEYVEDVGPEDLEAAGQCYDELENFRTQKIYEFQLRFIDQIKAEFQRVALTRYENISNIRPIGDTLIIFQADGVGFTAAITPKTDRLKRNSIRIER